MSGSSGRSKVLVLNRNRLTLVPYRDWLAPATEAVLLTSGGIAQPPERLRGYREVVEIDDYVGNPAVELCAHRLHERYGFDGVVALSERDVLRAARLRERWRIPGQHVTSATAFRDKLRMKELVSEAGVPVARFLPVRSVSDLFDAPSVLGYPLVVKPRRAVSSEGVAVLADEGELMDYLVTTPALRGDDPLNLMAEEYVDHELFLVDGLVAGEKLVWSWGSWMSSNLGHRTGEPLVSSILEPADPTLARLRGLAERALAALPLPDHTIVHMEIFGNRERGLVFNEVASRIGGARIDQMLASSFGVGLVETYLRGVSMGPDNVDLPLDRPGRMTSFALTRPRAGVLRALPADCPVRGVVDYEPLASVGSALSGPANSVSALAAIVTAGDTRRRAEADLAEALRWWEAGTVIDESPETTPARAGSG